MATTSPPMDFTDPDIQDFISLNDHFVTADEAALVAAEIVPAAASFKVGGPRGSSHMAITVRQALLRAVGSNNGPTAISVTYFDEYGGETFRGTVDIVRAIAERGEPQDATFEAMSVWQWLRNRNRLDPDYVLPKPINPHNSTLPDQLFDIESSEQMTALTEQVAALTERLQEAEAEIAALKVGIPHFRHMTPALRLVAEVQERYWGDTWEPNTIPKQFTILHELENIHGLSNAKAKNVEYVASPIDRVTGKNLCSSQIEP